MSLLQAKDLQDQIDALRKRCCCGVDSITGEGVDNTDPKNPIIEGGLEVLEVSVSSAQILAMNGAPVTIMAGIADTIIVPYMVVAKFDYGTVQYANGGVVNLIEETSGVVLAPAIFTGGNIDGAVDLYSQKASPVSLVSSLLRIPGKGLQISNGVSAFINGDGTIDLKIYYKTVTF